MKSFFGNRSGIALSALTLAMASSGAAIAEQPEYKFHPGSAPQAAPAPAGEPQYRFAPPRDTRQAAPAPAATPAPMAAAPAAPAPYGASAPMGYPPVAPYGAPPAPGIAPGPGMPPPGYGAPGPYAGYGPGMGSYPPPRPRRSKSFWNKGPWSKGKGKDDWFGGDWFGGDRDDFTDKFSDAWDDMLDSPSEMGEMPGGWTFPSVSVPNPVDVGDELETNLRDMPDNMRDAYGDGSSWDDDYYRDDYRRGGGYYRDRGPARRPYRR